MSNYQSKIISQYEKTGHIVLNVIKLSDSGYPDLICLKNGVATFIECKEAKDTLKPLQRHRIDELNKAGFIAFCVQEGLGVIYP